MQAASGHFPVQVEEWNATIGSSTVDVTFTAFNNMNMLVFTDTGSMGVLLKASGDGAVHASGTFTIQTLLGRRDCHLHELLARQLIALSHTSECSKPLLLGLGIKSMTPEVAKAVISFAKGNIRWR